MNGENMANQNPLVRCTECLMPTTRPDTEFNVAGVCSACVAFQERKNIDWDARERVLLNHLESLKPNGDGYHCVVPSSGGKDSHWQVLKLIELGVRPLVVTASTCMLTRTGAANIRNLARYATTVEVTPNLRVRALLNRLGLELVGDISWPEHVSIFHTPWRVAKQHGISTLFYGECPQNQYGGPLDEIHELVMTERWIATHGGHLGLRPRDMVGKLGITADDMRDYELPDISGMQGFFLGQFYPWDSHRNAIAAVNAGMIAEKPTEHAWWAAENLDNAQTGLHDYFGWLKYGYGRFCAQISVDIRSGMIKRNRNRIAFRHNCFLIVNISSPSHDSG